MIAKDRKKNGKQRGKKFLYMTKQFRPSFRADRSVPGEAAKNLLFLPKPDPGFLEKGVLKKPVYLK
jgi:hypothetical protein